MSADRNIVPPITHPLGRYWDQPSPGCITIDDTHALMDVATFAALCEYSTSFPSGVYDGKMWKRHDGWRDAPERQQWLLMWYGPCALPGKCSINSRIVLVS